MNLNIELNKDEVTVINELYSHFRQTEQWSGVRTINHKFGKSLLEKILLYQPPLIQIEENYAERKAVYKLLFEGIYLSPLAKDDLNLLRRYLQLLIEEFHKNPEILEFSNMTVEAALKINTEESRLLYHLIDIGYFWGGSKSYGPYWQVGVPEDIEDLAEIGIERYIEKRRKRFWGNKINKELNENKNDQMPINVFISYSVKDKQIAGRIKYILSDYGINGFLAHEDIRVSEEWKKEILANLEKADIFVPILSKNFKESEWTSQEAGIAFYRKVPMIPLCLDETIPYGFIEHYQGKKIVNGTIPLVDLIRPILSKFSDILLLRIIDMLRGVNNFRSAEDLMELIVPYLDKLDDESIEKITNYSIKNSQIWAAKECREQYLPKFLKVHGDKISVDELTILKYQIERQEWYTLSNKEISKPEKKSPEEPWIKFDKPWLKR